MNLSEDVLSLIGNTPLVRINKLARGITSELYAKLEFYNPSGSFKDRVAKYIIDAAEARGLIKPGDLIVEATSGNMGVAFALVGAVRDYRCIFALPETISKEKILAIKLFGAEVVLTPRGLPPSDERSCYKVAQRIAREKGGFYVNQYFNTLNPEAHYKTTGPEIWRDTEGKVDAVVCGIGTGGTITGIGRYLKGMNGGVRIIGVEPRGSVFRDYFEKKTLVEAGEFNIEGIGKNFIPGVIDFNYIDDVIQVYEDEALRTVEALVKKEGILAGDSSGAVMAGAIEYARTHGRDERIVVMLPDSGLKYLSKFMAFA